MSNFDHYSVVKVVEQCARRARIVAAQAPLGERDRETAIFLLTSWGCLLYDLLPRADCIRSYLGFVGGQEIDLVQLSVSLSEFKGLMLYQSKFEHHSSWRVTLRSFKHCAAPGLYYGILTPIRPLLETLFEEFSPQNFRPVFQWLTFLEKANLRDLDLKASGEVEYLDFEAQIEQWTYEPSLINSLRSILDEWTGDFDECVGRSFFPTFGPGAFAEETPSRRAGISAKYSHLGTDARLEYMLSRLPCAIPHDSMGLLERTNKIVFVPKSLRKNRIISKEPSSLGFFQHAVFNCLDDMIQRSAYLRARMDLHNQVTQVDAAWYGSLFGELATIDLSNASDSVTQQLVLRIINHPTLRRMLVCTRSTFAELPSGTRIRLGKFAPMGSAVCFPVETLVFAACCEHVTRDANRVDPSAHYEYCVYGDDIVISRDLVPQLFQTLSALHFKVNEEKSFWGDHGICFRESCGAFFARGEEITPIRISRGLFVPCEHDIRCHSSGHRLSFIALANQAFFYGFKTLRSCTLSWLERRYPRFDGICFANPDYPGNDRLITGYDSVSNYNLKQRPAVRTGLHPWDREYKVFRSIKEWDPEYYTFETPTLCDDGGYWNFWVKRFYLSGHLLPGKADDLVVGNDNGCPTLPEVEDTRPYKSRERLEWTRIG